MIRVFFLIAAFMLTTSSLMAQPPSPVMKIQADQIDFDGFMARLAGNVYMEHAFGALQCQKAVLLLTKAVGMAPQSPARGFSPERILLDGNVYVTLRDGSTITSDEADIDCLALEGVFTANVPNRVLYTTFVQRGLWKSKMNAESKAVRLAMKRIGGKHPQYTFTDLRSEDAVSIEYEDQKQATDERPE